MSDTDKNSIGNIEAISVGDDFGIKSTDSPFAESFYFEDYYDEKTVKCFIKNVEKLIRTSREYKAYIELLRTNIHVLNHDNILSNITNADVDLEFHHYPFSLYEIVEIVMLKHIAENEKFTSFQIAKEVMNLHYHHQIGLVPLTKTMHELAHSGNIFISNKQIFGNFRNLMKTHASGISRDLKDKIAEMIAIKKIGKENYNHAVDCIIDRYVNMSDSSDLQDQKIVNKLAALSKQAEEYRSW